MERMVSAQKDFVGRIMLKREGLQAGDRLRLVGLKPLDATQRIRAGSHVLRAGDQPSTASDQGHVTSACYSPSLGSYIALGLVKAGPERIGERVTAWNALHGEMVEAVICDRVFFDAENGRLHA